MRTPEERRDRFVESFRTFALRTLGWSFMASAVVDGFHHGLGLATFAFGALGLVMVFARAPVS